MQSTENAVRMNLKYNNIHLCWRVTNQDLEGLHMEMRNSKGPQADWY